ncbi:cationic peroxidase 1-like protein [Cinnamomum micranthum f. kanehirae]|uniref:Peroxidase n=1 Tax=Cinnamomum micranthum f. kanehirae TaxID=337451 RepID=A0A3S3MX54_9MAGN|nr:cationic peroxidase 1-like protein [Cinnamomum micranthum f. kanehirae]
MASFPIVEDSAGETQMLLQFAFTPAWQPKGLSMVINTECMNNVSEHTKFSLFCFKSKQQHMASVFLSTISLVFLLFAVASTAEYLSSNYYASSCPGALSTVRRAVKTAVAKEKRMGASLLRLHFHDCFVIGCDGSVLLDDTDNFRGEKTALPNSDSLRGFDVIDDIKSQLESLCPRVVSCADILAIAARDAVVELGGPGWIVELGRRDSLTASLTEANTDLPAPKANLSSLINSFSRKGLTAAEMVALSGAHTIGMAKCPSMPLCNLDSSTPDVFDNGYYENLIEHNGLLISDQELFNGGPTDALVVDYSTNSASFFVDFSKAMVKMGRISPLNGTSGEIRTSCRKVNRD